MANEPYVGIGVDLRMARERRRISLMGAAATLKIQQHYLAAIEQGRFDELPGYTYATGFVRAYAIFVGIEPEGAVERFRNESALAHGPTKLVLPEPIAEPRRPRGAVVLLSLLAAGVLYGGWAFLHDREGPEGRTIAEAPERLLALVDQDANRTPPARLPDLAISPPSNMNISAGSDVVSAGGGIPAQPSAILPPVTTPQTTEQIRPEAVAAVPDDPPATEAAPAAEAPMSATLAGESSEASIAQPGEAPSVAALSAGPASAGLTEPPPPPPPAQVGIRAPQQFGGGNAGARVVLRAKADSWVQIKGPRRELLLTRILRAGDTYQAPDRADLLLTTGNIGGLEIIVDGTPLRPLGPSGAVRRNISLDAEKLLAMAADRQRRR